MRILVTGGFGFLGSRIVQSLSDEGHEVAIGSRQLNHQKSFFKNINTFRLNWNNQKSLLNACEGIDAVIHTAGMSSRECVLNPKKAFLVNENYTERLASAAIQQSVNLFIHFSTFHVYSSTMEGKVSEKSPAKNNHPYAKSNLAGEKCLIEISKHTNLKSIILRLSNAFGSPIEKDCNCWKLLVNDLCKQAVTTKRMVLQTYGSQYRDFITISDLCFIIKKTLNQNFINGQIINVGSGKSKTVYQMALEIQKCYADLYNYCCPISRPDNNNFKSNKLDFQIDTLKEHKYMIENDIEKEIKDLLNFCSLHFTSN